MRRQIRVAINIEIDVAAVIFAIATLIAILI
jgi:hypothetical protein